MAEPTATPVPTPPEEEEYYSSWSLFLVCLLLILSLWTSYYLQIKRIRAVHETGVSIFAGMAVGLIVRLAPGTMIREMLTFKHTLFFNLLLPPIILNSGYELKQENFFRNFGSILTFAFLGTFISAVGVGILVYVYSFLGLESLNLGLVECLKFGSALSATDPVTILAIFNQYKVDPKLYTVIFGESLLNDAVSIVMYETLTQFHGTEEIFISSVFKGVGIFLLSFSVSMALGVAFGLGMSLLLKHSSLNLYPSIESCLVALSAYTCYFFSNGMSMSGIVSLLFCGITLKHYAYHTMSRRTQRTTKYIFSTLAQLSENFIFIYLGMSLFTSAPTSERVTSYVKPIFIVVTTVAVIFTRYAAVFPLSEGINFFHKHVRGQRQEELPHSYQMMLFWAGLRGAVGVALAAGFTGENAQTLRTTVLVVVVLTVLLFGGTTARMLEVLGIRTGVEDEAASSSDEEDVSGRSGPVFSGRRGGAAANSGRWGRYVDDEPSYLQNSARGAGRIGTHYNYNHQQQAHAQAQAQAGVSAAAPPFSPIHGVFSSASSESYDSDGEVLPLATTSLNAHGPEPASPSHPPRPAPGVASVGEDGKWFQALDERYLLPLFSNATASRTFHARRARRSAGASVTASPVGSDDEGAGDEEDGPEVELGVPLDIRGGSANRDRDAAQSRVVEESRIARGLASPMLRSNSSGERVGGPDMT
ncbi:Sodium/hydrogen exchanger family-domain-containing protein [Mycena rosella]|uniref:Sodium/hydrogen exchanger n=1 Tax=Mycena rosella TaxID=1033263 RepID=A0AAD7GPK9_MYCRO|nr:Sodium/hydrogen exchanger family-domain-containing protein [Mycena rosella]